MSVGQEVCSTKYGSIGMNRQVSYSRSNTPIAGGDSEEGTDTVPVVVMDEGPETEEDGQPPATATTSVITFADLGIPTVPQPQSSTIGKARNCGDVTLKEWIYMSLMLTSIAAVAAITIYRVAIVDIKSSDFTFGLVLIVNTVFCSILVVDGVFRERPSEIFILSVSTILLMIYLILNYTTGTRGDVKLARLVVGCVMCPLLAALGSYIAWMYHVSKRLIFRTVGANGVLQQQYRKVLAFQDFLKFDVQLGTSMVILIIQSRESFQLRDIVILAVGGPATLAWFVLGFLTFPKEFRPGAYLFFLFSPAEIAYICYKMYDVSSFIDVNADLAAATIACGVVALIVHFIVIVGGILVMRGFGLGLKEKLQE